MRNLWAITEAQSACFYVRDCNTEQHRRLEHQYQEPIRVSSRLGDHGCSRKAANLQYQLTRVERLNLTGKILLLTALCISVLILSSCSNTVEAKVHHSKRQTQQQLQQTASNQPSSGGRASTNWWNVWWQQYINEADQPTVRPIVAVSFNGRSINLSRQEQDQQQLLDMTDEMSFGLDSDRSVQQSPANLSPTAQQPQAANRKVMQAPVNQASWRMSSRPLERNMISQRGPYDELPMGIQMRGHMGRNKQDRPNQNVAPSKEQQVFVADGRQEEPIQQHYQMLDYSDENDPQLMSQDGNQTNDNDSEQEQSNDSSSRNMMAGENRKPTNIFGRGDLPTTPINIEKRPPVTPSTTTLPVTTVTSTSPLNSTTTTTLQPSQDTFEATTQAITGTSSSIKQSQITTTTTPVIKSSSPKITANIVETNRVVDTTTTTTIKPSIETSTRQRENEEDSTTEMSNQQTTAQTIIQTTTKSIPSTITQKSDQILPETSAPSTESTPTQKLSTLGSTVTTSSEVPSTTTNAPSTTTTPAAATGVETSSSTTESETSSASNLTNTSNNSSTTTRVTTESDTEEDEDGEDDEEDDSEDSTTMAGTPKITTTTTPAPESTGPSTQLPVIDLARLPKTTTTTTTTTKSTPVMTSTLSPSSTIIDSNRPTTRLMNANMDSVMEEDTAITVPIETFMRMMNQVAAMNEATTSDSTSSNTLSSTTPSLTSTGAETTTEEDQSMDTTTTPPQVAATTLPTTTLQVSTQTSDSTTTLRRKLQPPPTTTTTISSEESTTTKEPTTLGRMTTMNASSKPNTRQMENLEERVTTSAMDGTRSTMGAQRTVMLSIAPSYDGSKEGSVDTKIELMDLDLMPIQKMMTLNNQKQTVTSTLPMTSSSTTTGRIQSETNQETMMVDVEPGMRLRPPTTLSMNNGGAITRDPQPVYMIMMSQQMADELKNSSATTGKFTTTAGRLTMNPLRSTTSIPQITTTSETPPTTTTLALSTVLSSTTKTQELETKTSSNGATSSSVAETTPIATSTTTAATKETTSASSSANIVLNATTINVPLDTADKPQVINRGKTSNRIFGKAFNGTSSFMSTRLKTNFGIKQLSPSKIKPSANEKSSSSSQLVQNMAIRQFGGANRMSVLENQPVAFGRPSMVTSNNQLRSQQSPVFEYGASIVVKRPDEPLANGQMPNCTLTGKNFCVLTKDYPMNEVRQAVERSFRSVRIMYEELQTVSDQDLHKDDFNTTNNQAASGKFACQTQVEMMRPGWAKDEITKEWMLVVNTDVFPQRVRTESCAQPNNPCEFIAPFYDSTCQQRYSLHRMIAIDPHDPSRSPQVAVFKFPAGCVCRVHPIRKTPPNVSSR